MLRKGPCAKVDASHCALAETESSIPGSGCLPCAWLDLQCQSGEAEAKGWHVLATASSTLTRFPGFSCTFVFEDSIFGKFFKNVFELSQIH